MPKPTFVPPQPPQGVKYQNRVGAPTRSDKTSQRILSQSTRIHILLDKISPEEATSLELLAQQLGAQVTSIPEAANVIVTVLKAPKRILRHFTDEGVNVVAYKADTDGVKEGETDVNKFLGEGVGRDWRRFVVTPEWLDKVKEMGSLVDPDLYPAVKLKEEPKEEASYFDKPITGEKRKRSPSDSPLLPTSSHPSRHPTRQPKASPITLSSKPSPMTTPLSKPPLTRNTSTYYDPLYPPKNCPPWTNTRYACKRPSPLISPNQTLVSELEIIRNERKLTGDTYSEMAYMRAISALKAFPFPIPDPLLDPPEIFDKNLLEMRLGEVERLKGVGKKVFTLVKQFYTIPTGEEGKGKQKEGEPRIIEAKIIKRDRSAYVMTAFTELYGIGPIGAREAYNSGARSFADVLNRGKSLATHLTAKESVRILGDLRKPIDREECRSITEDIMKLVKGLLGEGVEVRYEICGGYRRGKERTFDLDVIIGHGESPSRALHMRLLEAMKRKGLITHIINVSTPASSFSDDPNPIPQEKESKGTIHIDIANIVVTPYPTPTNPHPIHRRVDLVFCPLRVYGATVLGWTGSMTFERDLRLWAKSKGYNFSFDGLTNLAEETVVETRSEEEVFEVLGLDWVDPTWRNCDA